MLHCWNLVAVQMVQVIMPLVVPSGSGCEVPDTMSMSDQFSLPLESCQTSKLEFRLMTVCYGFRDVGRLYIYLLLRESITVSGSMQRCSHEKYAKRSYLVMVLPDQRFRKWQLLRYAPVEVYTL